MFNSTRRKLLFCPAMLLLPGACTREAPVLSGATMGTTYSVIVPNLKRSDQTGLKASIEAQLLDVNNAMSTYQDDSYISRFNASTSTDWFVVPESFSHVVSAALVIAEASNGAFDPTLGPLIQRWGFGKRASSDVPSAEEIAVLLRQTGYKKLSIDTEKSVVRKSDNRLQVDLNAIAKGYAVDRLADEVEVLGYTDYLVEIGGELRVKGNNSAGDPWGIGIETPDTDLIGRDAKIGLNLVAGGVATSGDYRNAFEQDGKRYSHIIDARNGEPVSHNLASVTVVAETAMLADGWATALMVLGLDDGMKIAEQYGLICYFIVRDKAPGFRTYRSSAFSSIERN